MPISSHFSWIDWFVVVLYLGLTTWIGHALKGKQSTIHDFFLAGRSLPWPAVCGSIIATEISAITFIAVPGTVFAATGNFTYLQWAVGSIIARFIVGYYLVPIYYKKEVYSPYEFMSQRLELSIKKITTILFFLGAILGQSVRLLVTAIILRTITGVDLHLCILIIGLFAVGWTLMGGMTTVIWTDVVQFGLFIFGGLLALIWILATLEGGVSHLLSVGQEFGKLQILDLTTDPTVSFTLWVGLIAMPFQNLAAFGTDQLNTQRMFCCKNAKQARSAIIWSSCSQLITVLMLLVGLALFAYYQKHPLETNYQRLIKEDGNDYIFPIWITTVLPVGLSGLVLAGAFAAAISSLDSILTALSQSTLSLMYGDNATKKENSGLMLNRSRLCVIIWGVALPLFAILLNLIRGQIDMLNLAFGMVTYTYGPLLAILILALLGKKINLRALTFGIGLSISLTLYVRPDIYNIIAAISPDQQEAFKPIMSYAWLYPLTTILTLLPPLLFSNILWIYYTKKLMK
ncbi:MAG: sodium/solute symporter [Bacteroidota bacterium]